MSKVRTIPTPYIQKQVKDVHKQGSGEISMLLWSSPNRVHHSSSCLCHQSPAGPDLPSKCHPGRTLHFSLTVAERERSGYPRVSSGEENASLWENQSVLKYFMLSCFSKDCHFLNHGKLFPFMTAQRKIEVHSWRVHFREGNTAVLRLCIFPCWFFSKQDSEWACAHELGDDLLWGLRLLSNPSFPLWNVDEDFSHWKLTIFSVLF